MPRFLPLGAQDPCRGARRSTGTVLRRPQRRKEDPLVRPTSHSRLGAAFRTAYENSLTRSRRTGVLLGEEDLEALDEGVHGELECLVARQVDGLCHRLDGGGDQSGGLLVEVELDLTNH